MGTTPEPPGGCTPQPEPPQFHDRSQASDRGEVAVVAVPEATRCRAPVDRCPDDACRVAPLLLGGGREAGDSPPRPTRSRRPCRRWQRRLGSQGLKDPHLQGCGRICRRAFQATSPPVRLLPRPPRRSFERRDGHRRSQPPPGRCGSPWRPCGPRPRVLAMSAWREPTGWGRTRAARAARTGPE